MEIKDYEDRLKKAQEKLDKMNLTSDKYIKKLSDKAEYLKSLLGYNVSPDNAKEALDDLRNKYFNNLITREEFTKTWDYETLLDDYKRHLKDVEYQKEIVNKHQINLDKVKNKERIISNEIPQVFIDFLNMWKEKVFNYYMDNLDDYNKKMKQLEEERVPYIPYRRENPEPYFKYKEWEEKRNQLQDPIFDAMNYEGDNKEKYLDDLLEKEKRDKLIDLNNRVTKVVGVIQDASNLYIADDGNLNGVVIGDKGKANVTTIGAGGYNIQIFHYRTLVKPIK